jgi:two-component sensor histidine kinase
VEHGYPQTRADLPASGRIVVQAERTDIGLHLLVLDDGVGLHAGFELTRSAQLGLQIVQTLVTGELRGTLRLTNGAGGRGARAELTVPVSPPTTADPP